MRLMLGLFLFASSSMNWVSEEFTSFHQCVPSENISCLVDTYFVCPPGYYDGCIDNRTQNHKCVRSENGPSCDFEMSLYCPKNFEDGCVSGVTSYHLCVPSKGSLCTHDIEHACPSGFEDSCLK